MTIYFLKLIRVIVSVIRSRYLQTSTLTKSAQFAKLHLSLSICKPISERSYDSKSMTPFLKIEKWGFVFILMGKPLSKLKIKKSSRKSMMSS